MPLRLEACNILFSFPKSPDKSCKHFFSHFVVSVVPLCLALTFRPWETKVFF